MKLKVGLVYYDFSWPIFLISRLGETISDRTMDGREIVFVVSSPNRNRWIEEQRSKSDPLKLETVLIRDFGANAMTVTLKINDVVSKNIFRDQTIPIKLFVQLTAKS